MRNRGATRRGLLAGTAMLPPLARSRAGETAPLYVLCTGAVQAVVRDIALGFTAETDRHVAISMAIGGSIGRRLREGERADLVLNSSRQLAAMAGVGLVDGTSILELGRMRIGLGVPLGAALPGLATPEALRRALLAAPSIAYPDPAVGTPSGVHLLRLLDAMGIGAEMALRSRLYPHGLEAARAVAEGRVALVLAQVSEILATPGVVLAGPLPESVNLLTPYAGAVAARAQDRPSALALLRRLAGPEGQARFRAAGFLLGG